MTDAPKPLSVKQATALLVRFAAIDAQLALVEQVRTEALGRANAEADKDATPLLAKLEILRAQLEPWWTADGASLVEGKRKSLELGGCMIGTVKSRAKYGFTEGDDDAAAAVLKPLRWAKPYIRTRVSVDKAATLKALDGPHKAKLEALGFKKEGGADVFFVERVAQSGTMAGA